MRGRHGHRGGHHHHHEEIIETVIVTQPTYTTPTVITTTPTYTIPTTTTTTSTTYPTQTYPTQTQTYSTQATTYPTQTTTYPTQTYPTQSYPTQTQTFPTQSTTYPTQTTTYPTQTYPTQTFPTTTTTTFDPTKHPYFRGVVGPYSKAFGDQALLSKYNNDHKIAVIDIGHNDKGCTGVVAQYYVASQNLTVAGDVHFGSAHAYGGKNESILLGPDEYIIEFFGKQGKWIDSLGFKTNKGRMAEYGPQIGSFFDVQAPPGYHFSGLAGGVGEFLDYITFEVAPIPVTQTFNTSFNTTGTMGLQGTGGIYPGGSQPIYKPY